MLVNREVDGAADGALRRFVPNADCQGYVSIAVVGDVASVSTDTEDDAYDDSPVKDRVDDDENGPTCTSCERKLNALLSRLTVIAP